MKDPKKPSVGQEGFGVALHSIFVGAVAASKSRNRPIVTVPTVYCFEEDHATTYGLGYVAE